MRCRKALAKRAVVRITGGFLLRFFVVRHQIQVLWLACGALPEVASARVGFPGVSLHFEINMLSSARIGWKSASDCGPWRSSFARSVIAQSGGAPFRSRLSFR